MNIIRPADHCKDAKRALLLVGGEPGCEVLNTIERMPRFRKFIDVLAVWPDWLNRSKVRFPKFYGDTEIEPDMRPDTETIQAIRNLPRIRGKENCPIKITGRVLQQYRVFECAQRLGFLENQIIKSREDPDLLYQVVKDLEINLIIACGHAMWIPKKVVELVEGRRKGRVIVCHVCLPIDNERTRYLPPKDTPGYRGARIWDHLIDSSGDFVQVVLLEAGQEEYDSGRILATMHPFPGPEFMKFEMREQFRNIRAQRVIAKVADQIGDVLRYRLLPLLFTPRQLVAGGYGIDKLLRMGVKEEAIRNALEHKRKKNN
jgi:hypothetical protein